ncbi:MAG TPA: hypothetical protein VEB61_16855 [Candidatus Binatia bacterium]|nr:hypothetical protein [Candidatus Binatia bacterium]
MSWIKAALLAGFLSHLLIDAAPEALANDRNCRRGDRVQIQDLDMSPDPVIDGQRIRAWKARVRFDGRRDCNTDIYIREGNNVVGQARDYKLRSGVNDIEIPARDNFRFRGREICFNVQVDLDGSRQQIDANRRFCATQRTMWSMREPDDRRAQR